MLAIGVNEKCSLEKDKIKHLKVNRLIKIRKKNIDLEEYINRHSMISLLSVSFGMPILGLLTMGISLIIIMFPISLIMGWI